MNIPDLKYDYHDAVLTNIKQVSDNSIEISIDLFPVIYPEKPRVKIRFYDIYNIKKFSKIINEMTDFDNLKEDKYIGYNIQILSYDRIKENIEDHVYVYIKIAFVGHVTVHSKRIEFEIVK